MKPANLLPTSLIVIFYQIAGFSQTANLPTFKVTEWYNNRSAAVSLTFDDNLSGQFQYALPALNAHRFKGTFFICSGSGTYPLNWSDAIQALTDSHEVASHSVTHPDLRNVNNISFELGASHDSISAHIAPKTCRTIAWPFGGGGGSRPKEALIRDTAKNWYIGARNASIGPRGFEQNTNRNYFQIGSNLMGDFMTDTTFANTIDSATFHKGWYVALYHAVENSGYSLTHLQKLNNQLDSLEKRKANLWIAPFGDAMRYLRERHAATITYDSVITIGPYSLTVTYNVSLTDTLGDTSTYNQPLTLIANIDPTTNSQITVTGNNQSNPGAIIPWSVTDDGHHIVFNAKPNAGPYKIEANVTITGINPIIPIDFHGIYPNPASSQSGTNVGFYLHNRQMIEISIYDVLGNKVYDNSFLANIPGNNLVRIGLANFNTGVYVVRFKAQNQVFNRRLVVQ